MDGQFAGVCNRRKGRSVWRQHGGEIMNWQTTGVCNRRNGRNVWRQHCGYITHDHHRDKLFMMRIRLANLDALWSRESATVRTNRGRFNKVMGLSEMLGVDDPYAERGPYPEEDSFGMKVACMMLIRSLDQGVIARTIQYETMRGLRSHYSNFTHTIPGGAGYATIGDDSRGATFFANSPTNSY